MIYIGHALLILYIKKTSLVGINNEFYLLLKSFCNFVFIWRVLTLQKRYSQHFILPCVPLLLLVLGIGWNPVAKCKDPIRAEWLHINRYFALQLPIFLFIFSCALTHYYIAPYNIKLAILFIFYWRFHQRSGLVNLGSWFSVRAHWTLEIMFLQTCRDIQFK